MNRELKRYYRDILHLLPGNVKQKKQLMETLWESVSAYIEENPQVTIQEVQAHFGTPQQIAAAYLEEMSTPEVIKKIKTRKTVICIICAAVALALLMWGIVLAIALSDAQNSAKGNVETGNLVIEEMEENK